MSDGWKHMPPTQPRECVSCGNRITLNNYAWFRTAPPQWTKCRDCWPRTIQLSFCGCDYCLTAQAAFEDAQEAHRAA